MIRLALFFAGLLITASLDSSVGHAQTVAHHHGDVDPVTTGWTRFADAGSSWGPLVDGALQVWSMRNGVSYLHTFTPMEQLQIRQQGWTLSAVFRTVAPGVTAPVAGLYHNFDDGIGVYFGLRANGAAYLQLLAAEPFELGPQYTISGEPGAYHRLDVIFRMPAQSADFYVDGVLVFANIPGHASAQDPGLWIENDTPTDPPGGPTLGEARFHHVELRIGDSLPVPVESSSWGGLKALYRGDDGPRAAGDLHRAGAP